MGGIPFIFNTLHQLLTVISCITCDGKPEMARTSAFFGSVTPKAFCQKRLKLSFGFAELVTLRVPRFRRPFSLVRFFLDEQKEMNI